MSSNSRKARKVSVAERSEIRTAWRQVKWGKKNKVVEAAQISWASVHNILAGKNAEVDCIGRLRVALGLPETHNGEE